MTTALTLPERAAIALGDNANAAKLQLLAAESAGIVAVTNADGRAQAHRAGMVLAKTRTAITNTGKAAREDATAFSKAVIQMEKDLIKIIEPEEQRVIGLRDGFDAEEKARKDALIAAERARVDEITARITEMRTLPMKSAGRPAAEISAMIGRLVDYQIDASFEECIEDAKVVRLWALDELAKAESVQRGIEVQAESDRQEAARVAAQAKADREELAAAQAKLKADQEAAQAELQKQRDAQAAELQAERDRLDAIRKLEDDKRAFDLQARRDKADAEMLAERKAMDARQARVDHGEALQMNAEFDQLAAQRLEAASVPVAAHVVETLQPAPVIYVDYMPSDDEIIALISAEYGMSTIDAIDRLANIDFVRARSAAIFEAA
jgi:hypothetical protein